MCFGLASSPGQFQRLMDSAIRDLHDVAAYLDDLIITGATEEEHWNNLERLMKKLYHKPLVTIFPPKKQLPFQTAQRLQRYAIKLIAYQFDIRYKVTKEHGNANDLSR